MHNTIIEPACDIRIKETNRCSWDCKWCHHEGSNIDQDLQLSSHMLGFLSLMREELGITTIHLTGGEPTLHPNLHDHIAAYTQLGFNVGMTSNGSKPTIWPLMQKSGLKGANFSLHTLDTRAFAGFHRNIRSQTWAKKALQNTCDSIKIARAIGLEVKVNTTITNSSSDWKPIYEFCKQENIPLRIQNELNSPDALPAIEEMIHSVNGKHLKTVKKGATSRISHEYSDSDGYRFRVKLIAPANLVNLCTSCLVKNHCTEGFYTIRLEPAPTKENFEIRLCLHRNDKGSVLPPDEFIGSAVFQEIKRMYSEQYQLSHVN
jgi:GTP 3',8-cyclase